MTPQQLAQHKECPAIITKPTVISVEQKTTVEFETPFPLIDLISCFKNAKVELRQMAITMVNYSTLTLGYFYP